ncbi:efflux RND transporter periplasmic adaptor subunit [Chitinasiproducens palmae]|uniref:Membrane fusion protein, macrolide-specific efflux system n=1 Tax=Chitinasiproducens palmae TaxID=1770053 RepID=A0A1H2PIJ2_9BURK|nr:efflux RND transporter periplasmic adaptor subunit [Chitinasiproducens palmae]SDV46058.1 membrane fusion protein, macrolide-specific efflux system [Chitinasiproducens palmae]
MPTRLRRPLIFLPLVAAALGALLWLLFIRSRESIETTTIRTGDIEVSVTALGTLQPRNYVDVGAQASGAIRRIAVQPGDAVRKGALLAEIDPAVQQARVDVARASLAALRAELAEQRAERELAGQRIARQRQMLADGATRLDDLQSAQATLRVAEARVAKLRAQIDGAMSGLAGDEAQLGYTRIYAPMSGTVVSLDAREGQTLNATYQTPRLLRIADLSRMTVWTQVSEADIGRITPDMRVYFTTLGGQTDAGPRRWSGRLRQILPAPPRPTDQDERSTAAPAAQGAGKVVRYTVLVDVDNKDGALMPEMTAQVFFVTAAARAVTLAPMAALQLGDAGRSEYRARVLSDGNVVTRQVKIGVHDRVSGEVLSGLRPGDALITSIKHVRAAAGRFQW